MGKELWPGAEELCTVNPANEEEEPRAIDPRPSIPFLTSVSLELPLAGGKQGPFPGWRREGGSGGILVENTQHASLCVLFCFALVFSISMNGGLCI